MNQKYLSHALSFLILLAAAPAPAGAQTLGGASIAADATIARADVRWMQKVASAGAAEVEFGKLAAAQARRGDVRTFGSAMVEQHARANDELNELATQKRVVLLNRMDSAHTRLLVRLTTLSGDEFDREYMRTAGIRDHTDAGRLFADGVDKLKDPDLKIYAAKMSGAVRQHMQMIREMPPVQ
ncbi:MAG: hypothetical protein JWN73_931 [Betaproteobacteria bacterium]|nr:hypothetical protein [Betaproteobacteria bacterium]